MIRTAWRRKLSAKRHEVQGHQPQERTWGVRWGSRGGHGRLTQEAPCSPIHSPLEPGWPGVSMGLKDAHNFFFFSFCKHSLLRWLEIIWFCKQCWLFKCFLFPALLRYKRHTTLCKLKMYNVLIWHTCILQ